MDDSLSKLGLSQAIETIESIDDNHMQMDSYSIRDVQEYRAIAGDLKAYVRKELES